jgi:hypothetical protein
MVGQIPAWLHDTAALEQRKHPRSRVLWMATLDTKEGPLSCVVLDVSRAGAKLQFAAPIFPVLLHQEVELVIEPLGSLGAEVIWQQGERMGIRFNANPMLIASIIGGALKL